VARGEIDRIGEVGVDLAVDVLGSVPFWRDDVIASVSVGLKQRRRE
jgi:hypothetical protein